MPAYTTRNDILSRISATDIVPFLDDDADGYEDSGLLDNIIANVSSDIDGALSSIYQTPFNPVPAFVHSCATVFTCYELYRRRLTPDETNPFKTEHDAMMDRLVKIGNRELPLDLNIKPAVSPGGFSGRPGIYASGITGNALATTM